MSLEEAYKKAAAIERKNKMIETCIRNQICPECGTESIKHSSSGHGGVSRLSCRNPDCRWEIYQ